MLGVSLLGSSSGSHPNDLALNAISVSLNLKVPNQNLCVDSSFESESVRGLSFESESVRGLSFESESVRGLLFE